MNNIESLPSDYESCGECGFDHAYEYEEAHKAHTLNLIEDEDDNIPFDLVVQRIECPEPDNE